MKTTTVNAVTKRLESLTVKSESNRFRLSKSSKHYQFAKQIIAGAKQIRPCYTSGRGRFCTNQDHTDATMDLLKRIGIDCILTNDAPRGSATGNLITITTKIK